VLLAAAVTNADAQSSASRTAMNGPSGAVSTNPACPEPEARQFDFWVGQWDINNRYFVNGERWVDAGVATNLVHPVLGGCAVVEHWAGNLGRSQIRGFSIRMYDPEKGKWVLLLSWPNPERPGFTFLEGNFRHGRGEFFTEGTNAAGDSVLTRYSFSDVTDSSLRWDAASSTDGGAAWSSTWIMEFQRRDDVHDGPVLNAPSASLHRCTGDHMRELDDLHGVWETSGMQPKSPGAVSTQIMPILDGCAQMELLSIRTEAGPFEAFLVRAFFPDEDRWKGYLLTTANRSFIELNGRRDGDSVRLSGEGTNIVYTITDEGALTMQLDAAGVPTLDQGAWNLIRR
jgi:hypothetical protein